MMQMSHEDQVKTILYKNDERSLTETAGDKNRKGKREAEGECDKKDEEDEEGKEQETEEHEKTFAGGTMAENCWAKSTRRKEEKEEEGG